MIRFGQPLTSYEKALILCLVIFGLLLGYLVGRIFWDAAL